jgi:hypothetical protein
MIPGTYNFTDAYKGDTYDSVEFHLTENGSDVNLTGSAILIQFKESSDSDSLLALGIGSGITVTNAAGGVFEIDDLVINLEPRTYVYDIQITNGARVDTYLSGKLKVKTDISR